MTDVAKNYGVVILGDNVLLSKNDEGVWEIPFVSPDEDGAFNKGDLVDQILNDADIEVIVEQEIGTEDGCVYWHCKPCDEEICMPESAHNSTSKWVDITMVAEELDEDIPEFMADFFETREVRKATIW